MLSKKVVAPMVIGSCGHALPLRPKADGLGFKLDIASRIGERSPFLPVG